MTGIPTASEIGNVELFGRIDNLFDSHHSTFGTFADAEELGFESPRFLSPGSPRRFLFGARARL